MPRELQPCGTRAAYQRHCSRGEQPCSACKAVNTESSRTIREADLDSRRAREAARNRAFQRLKQLHPDEYKRLLIDELSKLTFGEVPDGPR